MSAICMSTAVSFSQGLGPLALAPMFPQLMKSFDADLASVVKFTGVCILVLGFSNFFWCVLEILDSDMWLTSRRVPSRQLSVDGRSSSFPPLSVCSVIYGERSRRRMEVTWEHAS